MINVVTDITNKAVEPTMYRNRSFIFPAVLFLLVCLSFPMSAGAEISGSTDDESPMYSLMVSDADGRQILPVISLKGGSKLNRIKIAFDVPDHVSDRFVWRLRHVSHEWKDDEGLNEDEYMTLRPGAGQMSPFLIEEGAWSRSTTMLYTHYSFTVPSAGMSLRMSGNYILEIFREEDADMDDAVPVGRTRLVVTEDLARLGGEVTGSTDIDSYTVSQQVSVTANIPDNGQCPISSPVDELHLVVTQNGRPDAMHYAAAPSSISAAGSMQKYEWSHCKDLIFYGGMEYYRFDAADERGIGAGIEKSVWHNPVYHIELIPQRPRDSYTAEPDVLNGGYKVRNVRGTEGADDTESAYVIVHFRMDGVDEERQKNGEFYVAGAWSDYQYNDTYKMRPVSDGSYEAAVLLKQGYYSYTFMYLPDDGETAEGRMPADFFQTRNEYTALLYAHPRGTRGDRLIGILHLNTSQDDLK